MGINIYRIYCITIMKKLFLYMSAILLLIYLGVILLLSSCNTRSVNNSDDNTKTHNGDNYQIVWQDEFDYSGLPNSSKWEYDTEGNDAGWGNDEAQYYTDANGKNARVENGVLQITAHRENYGGKEFTSARLIS